MSLFFKSAPEKEYHLLCEEVQKRCTSVGRAHPGIEAYEGLMIVWCEQMQKRNKAHLAGPLAGSGWVRFPALLEPLDSVTMLAQLIGMHTIQRFGTTKYGANLNFTLGTLVKAELEDAGGLNRLFQELNPKSYETYLKEYQQEPFEAETLRQVIEALSSAEKY